LFSNTIYASQVLFNEIARNISTQNKVIRLNLPVEGIRFRIVWITADGKKWGKTHLARKGNHSYEMRNHPAWNGKVQLLAVTNVRPITSEIIKPLIEDEIDIFLAPEQWNPSTINALYGHTLLGWSWNIILILLIIFFSTALYCFNKINLALSLLLGFVIAWGVMDVRTIIDHFVIADKIQDNQSMNQIKHLKKTSEIFAGTIGTGTWTQEGLPWPHTNVVAYTLAEHPYVSYQHNSKFDFLIVQGRNQLILLESTKK
jgi:hypothetical protein